jgi:hypothetical protein
MKTRKRASTQAINASAPANPPAEPSAIDAAADSQKPNRISFNVTPDGSPDWNRMLPKTKEQLTELLKNKQVQEALGITPEEAKKPEELGFGEDEANALLDFLSPIFSFSASRFYGVPMDITSQAFTFTPDHRKKVNPPLTRVLNKWGPSLIKQWKDEIGLAIILAAILNSQVRIMHMLEDKRKRETPRRPPAPVTPISETKPPVSVPPEPAPVVESKNA